ncbi:hypothetical protein M758_4G093400 [Ceratodon purpureus]|nr:hypothetical protein M758_4G093400 [Ceratodon purpureus]
MKETRTSSGALQPKKNPHKSPLSRTIGPAHPKPFPAPAAYPESKRTANQNAHRSPRRPSTLPATDSTLHQFQFHIASLKKSHPRRKPLHKEMDPALAATNPTLRYNLVPVPLCPLLNPSPSPSQAPVRNNSSCVTYAWWQDYEPKQ